MKNGDLVASFFGGTKERNPDCWYLGMPQAERRKKWTIPQLAADGVFSLKDPQAILAGIDSTCTPVKDAKGKTYRPPESLLESGTFSSPWW